MAQNTRLEIILDVQGTKFYLDTDGIEAVPLTFNVANLKDISQTKGSFSKTITVPETANNRDIFNNITDLSSASSFNPNLRNRAFVLVDSILVFEGYFQLSAFTIEDNIQKTSLSIYLTSDTSDFYTVLGEDYIEADSYDEFSHTWDYNNITTSWGAGWQKGYYYPLIDYGYDWDYTKINGSVATSSYVKINQMYPAVYARTLWNKIFNSAGFTYKSTTLDTIAPFNKLIIPYNGSSLEYNQAFADLHGFLVGSTYSGAPGSAGSGQAIPLAATYSDQSETLPSGSIFWNYQPNSTQFRGWQDYNNGNINQLYRVQFADETTSPFGDPNNLWNLNNFQFTNTSNYPVSMRFDVNMTLAMKFRYSSTYPPRIYLKRQYDTNGNYVAAGINVKPADICANPWMVVGRNGSTIFSNTLWSYLGWWDNTKIREGIKQTLHPPSYNQPGYMESNFERRPGYNADGNPTYYEIFSGSWYTPTMTLYPGEKVWLEFEYQIAGSTITTYPFPKGYTLAGVMGGAYAQVAGVGGVTYSTSYPKTSFGNEVSKSVSPGNLIPFNQIIPKQIKKRDFILSIIKMFNLIVEPDKNNPKNLLIETADYYYATGTVKDWSAKIDFSQPIDVQVLGDTQNKRFVFKYKDDKDYLNTDYLSKTKRTYGDQQVLSANEFADGEKKIELIFSPTPNIALPLSATTTYTTTPQSASYSSIIIPKIFSVNNGVVQMSQSNIRILYRNTLQLQTANYWFLQNNTSGQLSTMQQYLLPYAGHFNNPGTGLNEDINFGITDGLYFPTTLLTTNNLYLKYWRKTIEQLTNANSRIVTVYLYLNPQDIYDMKFNDSIYLNLNGSKSGSGAGQYYKINKVESYDPTFLAPCKVELIKYDDITVPSAGQIAVISGGSAAASIALTNTSTINQYSQLPSNNGSIDGSTVNVVSGSGNLVSGISNVNNGSNNLVSGSNNAVTGSLTSVIGTNNAVVAADSAVVTNNTVIGSNNTLSSSVSQTVLVGRNIQIVPTTPVVNAVAIGNNVKVESSNTTVIGGIIITSNNYVSGSRNEVLTPFSDNTSINYISGSRNTIRQIGSQTNINIVDAGRSVVI